MPVEDILTGEAVNKQAAAVMAASADMVYTLAIVFGILSIVGLIYYLMWRAKAYDFVVIIKKRNGQVPLVYTTKGRIKKRKGEVDQFIVQGKNSKFKGIYFPIPPDACTDVLESGKKYVCGVITENMKVTWVKDKNITLSADNKYLEGVEPFIQEDRQIIINQEIKALQEEGFQWTKWLIPIIMMVFFIIFIVIVAVFWKDVMEPMNQAVALGLQIQVNQKLLLDRLLILQGIYNITNVTLVVNQQPVPNLIPYTQTGGGK